MRAKGTVHIDKRTLAGLRITAIAFVLLMLPVPTRADGGFVVPNPELWAMLSEGQQIAVVRLTDENRVRVELFVSLLDSSGQSNEVVFFVPLGADARDLAVTEEASSDFRRAFTKDLDRRFSREARRAILYKENVRASLLAGPLIVTGLWGGTLGVSMGTLGSSAPVPIATFETPHSHVAVYGLGEDTDLETLIATTGLASSVRDTLARLRGQQIAVVALHTQPTSSGSGAGGDPRTQSESGIHLGWNTSLASDGQDRVYAYPLGTGTAWAHPIEMTRIYVVAPPGRDFEISYPRLGRDLSDYMAGDKSWGLTPWILDAEAPAYAIENIAGGFGRVWRATYVKSNSAEDILVTSIAGTSKETRALRWAQQSRRVMSVLTWPVGLGLSALVWVGVWRLTMKHILGVTYGWWSWPLWRDALLWGFVLPFALGAAPLVPMVGLLVLPFDLAHVICIGLMPIAFWLPGLAMLMLLSRRYARRLGVGAGRVVGAYIGTVLLYMVLYAPVAVGYAVVVGAV